MAYELLQNIVIDTSIFEDVYEALHEDNYDEKELAKICELAARKSNGTTDFGWAFLRSVQFEYVWTEIRDFIEEYIDGKLDEMKE